MLTVAHMKLWEIVRSTIGASNMRSHNRFRLRSLINSMGIVPAIRTNWEVQYCQPMLLADTRSGLKNIRFMSCIEHIIVFILYKAVCCFSSRSLVGVWSLLHRWTLTHIHQLTLLCGTNSQSGRAFQCDIRRRRCCVRLVGYPRWKCPSRSQDKEISSQNTFK